MARPPKNINLRDVDFQLHKTFKYYCEYKGHTMSWVLKRLMKAYVDDSKEGLKKDLSNSHERKPQK